MSKKNKNSEAKSKNNDEENVINDKKDQTSDHSLHSVKNSKQKPDQNGTNLEENKLLQDTLIDDNKEKKTLKFQLPEKNRSKESFSSVSSVDSQKNFKKRPSKKTYQLEYIARPIRHNHPRTAATPCITKQDVEIEDLNIYNTICLANTSSSKQLFETLRSSPSPSAADINLINATYLRMLEAVEEAVNDGADVNTFQNRQTPLIIATTLGDERLVQYLLSLPKINTNFQNVFGETSLIIAIRNSSNEIVQLLLKKNADVNVADNIGRTPLHAALFQQNPRLVKLLLAYGANYEKADIFGERPMYTAAVKKPNLQCLKILLRFGATPDYYHSCGNTLLSSAILHFTDFKVIKALVCFGASIDSRDLNSGRSALHITAIIDDVKIAKFLLSKGANPNLKTFYNFTPYEEAIFHKNLEVAECLFQNTNNASLKALILLRDQKETNFKKIK